MKLVKLRNFYEKNVEKERKERLVLQAEKRTDRHCLLWNDYQAEGFFNLVFRFDYELIFNILPCLNQLYFNSMV